MFVLGEGEEPEGFFDAPIIDAEEGFWVPVMIRVILQSVLNYQTSYQVVELAQSSESIGAQQQDLFLVLCIYKQLHSFRRLRLHLPTIR